MTEGSTPLDLRSEVEIPRDGILSRTIFTSDRVTAVLFGFDVGQELSEHTAASPAIVEILDGEADVVLGDASHHLAAGAWFHMPAGMPHAIRATTPLRMLLLLLPDRPSG
jgi:quercetin dioxygenase-like cupin family protein